MIYMKIYIFFTSTFLTASALPTLSLGMVYCRRLHRILLQFFVVARMVFFSRKEPLRDNMNVQDFRGGGDVPTEQMTFYQGLSKL